MIHYHGLPITPASVLPEAIGGGHAFVSFEYPDQIEMAMDLCQTFAVDNGAFSKWKSGQEMKTWSPFYEWLSTVRRHPAFAFAVVPDVIDGTEDQNDELLNEWPFPRYESAAVWHLHESMERLERMVLEWPRIAFGSSGQYSVIGTDSWWQRINDAMEVICDNGLPKVRLHGLRMLDPEIFTRIPFSSADSTNIARNIGLDSRWNGSYVPYGKAAKAKVIRQRVESNQAPGRWTPIASQPSLM